ncbi:MAG TPA: hypothetical protein VFB67_10425 [Candidatus Polarisedimenticolaceae bacterium]|nr:hypothetical protein [Candidatus Polarisedimenticolaceae bacterium]
MIRRAAILASAAVALATAPHARADVQRIAGDGTVHRVDVEPYVQPNRVAGTVLKSTRQKPKGGKETSWIPGTDDVFLDREPVLEIDPATGKPVVVWSRNEGTGFNIYVSKFDGTCWSAARLLIKTDADDIEPRIRVDRNYLHVVWRQDLAGQPSYWRWSFKTSTLDPVYGPERLPTDDPVLVPPEGGTTTGATDISWSERFFCASIFSRIPGDPGRSYIWGVRDEPVPINFRQAFELPAEVKAIVASDAEWVGGRITYWFTTTDKLYYTIYTAGKWSEMRVIELGAPIGTADARLLIFDLNRRNASGGL